MRKIGSLLVVCGMTACAGDAQDRSEPPAKHSLTAAAQEHEPEPKAPSPQARDASTSDKPVPPLSTPNARPSDGGVAPREATSETAPSSERPPLLQAGEAAQACYADAGLPRGTAGKLQLRITLDTDGKPERVEVDRAASTAKLLGGKLEQCVVAAFKKQKFPAPRSDADVLLNVPLQFKPTQ